MKHIVGFSGGCDSQACAGWVLERFPKADVILLNSDAGGNEHPLTTEHIRWHSEHVHPVVMVQAIVRDLMGIGSRDGATYDRRQLLEAGLADDTALLTFDMLAYVKGIFPSRKAQFCTKILKLQPQLRWMADNLPAGESWTRYAGVRADESQDRKDLPERQWDDWFDCELVRPLIKWSKADVFAYLKARGEQVNPLYTMGFGRVGCAPCINSGKEDILNWATRFPDMIDKVREWERKVGRTFFAPMVPGKVINWVDAVVEWAKTVRGGKQYALPFFQAEASSGACSSKYGLCE